MEEEPQVTIQRLKQEYAALHQVHLRTMSRKRKRSSTATVEERPAATRANGRGSKRVSASINLRAEFEAESKASAAAVASGGSQKFEEVDFKFESSRGPWKRSAKSAQGSPRWR